MVSQVIEKAQQVLDQGNAAAALAMIEGHKGQFQGLDWHTVTLIYRALGRWEEAFEAGQKLVKACPDADALALCGTMGLRAEAYSKTLPYLDRGIKLLSGTDSPLLLSFYKLKAHCVHRVLSPEEIRDFALGWVKVWPDDPSTRNNACSLLFNAAMLTDALTIARGTCQRPNPSANDWSSLLGVSQELGYIDEAIHALRKAYELEPIQKYAANLLYMEQVLEDRVQPDIDRENRRICDQLWPPEKWLPKAMVKRGTSGVLPDRRLRVGFLTPDMRRHSVASFSLLLVENMDRSRFETFGYSATPKDDYVTEEFKAALDHYRPIHRSNNDEVAQMVVQDGIDILIEMAGHTAGSRLGTFARRPAPIQVTWLGYPDKTGMFAADVNLCDRVVDPEARSGKTGLVVPATAREVSYDMPNGYHCWRPVSDCPDVEPRPDGPPVLGCFGIMLKMSDPMIALWSDILHQVPDAKILLKTRPLGEEGGRDLMRERFARHGISDDRLILRGRIEGQNGHLSVYNSIHLGLDTMPYNGTTTLCEALWMGTPVVTMKGQRRAARVAESLLRALGGPYPEHLLADDRQGYVDKAVSLLKNRPLLAELSQGLRPQMAQSPLRDEAGFARDFENALEDIYKAMGA